MSVAVHDGARVLAAQREHTPRQHGELLSGLIASALDGAGAARGDLTAVAVGTGPGPYTGLRAGLVTARVLGSALGIPVLGICSLDVIARQAARVAGREFLVAADARRKEVYWARYAADGSRISGPAVGAPAKVAASVWGSAAAGADGLAGAAGADGAGLGGVVPVAGEGPDLYAELAGCPVPPRYPDAGVLAEMAVARLPGILDGRETAEPAEPLYLRRPDAREPGQRKRVLPC